jgi:autotransporter translocation and assembly factor TamB
VLTDSLLEINPGTGDFASAFTIKHIDLRHGEIKFKGQDITMQLLDFNIQSGPISEGLAFKLTSPHLKIIFPFNGEPVTLEGNLSGEIRQQGTSWKINQLLWQTKDFSFNLNGRILKDSSFYLNASAQGDPENILRPLLEELAVKGLTYVKAKIVKNIKNKIQIKADFTSPYCSIKENSCSNLEGNLSWNNLSRDLNLETTFDTPLTRGWVQVASKDGETDIAIHDIPAAYLANVLSISHDAPLAGIVSHGEIKINADFINGKANLNATPTRPLTLPFVASGTLEFQRDKKNKQTTFSGRELQFNGGQVSISGQINSQKKTLDIKINAALKNIENVSAYSAYYLDIDLLPWKLSQGNGMFSLELNIKHGAKHGKSQFAIQHFLANQQAIESLQGDIRINPLITQGDFKISAPDLQSLAKMDIADRITTIRFQDVRGEAGKILKILNNKIALSGKITGAFTYQKNHNLERPSLQGTFQGPQMRFMGYPLDQVSSDLHSNLSNIELSSLRFGLKGGEASGEVAIDFQQKKFAINGRIEHIDISRLNDKFSGQAEIEVNGRGEFLKDPLEISYRLAKVHFYPDREFSVSGKARVFTDFSDFTASSSGELLNPAGVSPLTLEISRQNSSITGRFNMNLLDLNLLIPWKNNTGTMRLLGQIYSSEQGSMRSRGVAIFSGQTLSLPNFSHSLDNFQATLTFDNMKFNLQSMSGEMGGGKVDGNGQLEIEQGKLQGLTFNLQGKSMRLYPMDRVSCQVNADLTLKYLSNKLFLSGTLGFLSANWQREIDEPMVFNTHADLSTAESKIREMLQLDINMNGENIQINNSLGRINGKFKLKLSGTAGFPVLLGTFDGNQGEIHFSDRSFNLLKAKLVFNDNLSIDPLITIESEAFIQNYRIRFDIKGRASSAKPELVSSPPLPPQEVLALVSLGEAFIRKGSQEISSQLGSTALITTELGKEIKNRANQLLGINLLRIDPILNSQSAYDTSRLTIGTSITKNLIVVYSTKLSTTRQEVYYLQYQLSPAVSLIYMKNEEGRYSLDLRLRKRR